MCCIDVWTQRNLVDFKYHYLHSSCIIQADSLTLTLHRVDNNSLQAGMRFSSSSNLSLCFLSWHHQQGRGGEATKQPQYGLEIDWEFGPGEIAWEGEWLEVAGRGGLPREKAQAWRLLAGVLTLLSIQLLTKNMGGVTRESISCTDGL